MPCRQVPSAMRPCESPSLPRQIPDPMAPRWISPGVQCLKFENLPMDEQKLDQLLHHQASEPPGRAVATVDFADAILGRLPGMRYVIPGSHPGLRILMVAGVLGLLTASGISLFLRLSSPAPTGPPPMVLFQPGAVETPPVTASEPPLPANPVSPAP